MTLSRLEQIRQQAAQVANVGLDMSEVSKGGGGRRLLPAGNALGRLVMYREFGNHAREYQGKAKAPAMVVRLGFALWGQPQGSQEAFHTVDGDKVKPGLLVSFDLVLGNNEKSKTKIAFDKLNYKGKAKRFVDLIGETFIVPVKVKKGSKADSKPYNEIDWAGILPANDPISGQPYPVPDAPDDMYQVFLWDAPTKEDWDAMHIEGTNDQGKSKNFLQAKCIEAVNFEGSLLQQMLGGELPDVGMGVEGDGEEEDEAGAPAVPSVPAATATPAVPSVPQVTTALPADVPFDNAIPAGTGSTAVPAVPGVPAIPGIPSIPSL